MIYDDGYDGENYCDDGSNDGNDYGDDDQEINNNRIVVNKIMVPSPFTDDEPKIAKSY